MEVNYKQWSRGYKKIVNDWSEEEAHQFHDERKLYFVVLGNTKSLCAFLEISNHFVYVGFLDSLQREYMKYEFSEVETNKLFLKEVQVWEYEGNSDTKIFSTRYRFTREGHFGIRKVNLRTEAETVEPKTTINVSNLNVSYPTFGEYENLIQLDRIDLTRLPL